MQAFKLYFKIVRKSVLFSIIIYVVIFSALAFMFSNSGVSVEDGFETTKCKVAVINNDNSEMANNLVSFVKENSNPVNISTDTDGMKDALFFRQAEYILIIPAGFGNSFISGSNPKLEMMSIPDSTNGKFVDMMINNYLNTVQLYINNSKNMDFNKIIDDVKNDMNIKTDIIMSSSNDSDNMSPMNYYFNYTAYPLICVIVLGVSVIMMVVNKKDIIKRNSCSPIDSSKFNIQIFLGNAVYSIIIWLLFMIYSIILYPEDSFSTNGLILMLNTLIFVICILSMSFLIGNISNKKSIHPISNIVSLGSCFLGGAFVPQSMLSDSVKKIAVINPTYWFIKSNDNICTLSVFDCNTLKSVFFNMGVMLAFTLAFLSIGLVIAKNKRTSN